MSLFSKRALEGYLLVDHSAAPGVAREIATGNGNAPPVAAGRTFEAPTITCSHCQRVVIVNPLRTRERAYCPKCDHYICDECEARRVAMGGACKTFKQVMDEVDQALSRPSLIL
jgi:hypothetical protein